MDKSNLADLLRECADALYYVNQYGDGFQFNLSKYEELALECDEAVKRLTMQKLQNALVNEALEDFENEICGECLFIDDCHKWHYKCPAYKVLMKFEK